MKDIIILLVKGAIVSLLHQILILVQVSNIYKCDIPKTAKGNSVCHLLQLGASVYLLC